MAYAIGLIPSIQFHDHNHGTPHANEVASCDADSGVTCESDEDCDHDSHVNKVHKKCLLCDYSSFAAHAYCENEFYIRSITWIELSYNKTNESLFNRIVKNGSTRGPPTSAV